MPSTTSYVYAWREESSIPSGVSSIFFKGLWFRTTAARLSPDQEETSWVFLRITVSDQEAPTEIGMVIRDVAEVARLLDVFSPRVTRFSQPSAFKIARRPMHYSNRAKAFLTDLENQHKIMLRLDRLVAELDRRPQRSVHGGFANLRQELPSKLCSHEKELLEARRACDHVTNRADSWLFWMTIAATLAVGLAGGLLAVFLSR